MAYDRDEYLRNRKERIARANRYQKEHREERSAYLKEYHRRRRLEAIAKLGGRCSSEKCRWMNEDETFRCNDARLLQIDHVNGNGHKELRQKSPDYIGNQGVVKKILKGNTTDYQLLCPTCNWIKRVENGEM